MITLTEETHRFYTGNTITYVDADIDWLFEQSLTADDVDQRTFAAAGLMRAVLNVPARERLYPEHATAVEWTSKLVIDVRANPDDFISAQMNDYVAELPAVDAILDSVSVTATEANRPAEMAGMIHETIKEDGASSSDILLVAVGHGGIIAAADTFLSLDGNNNEYWPVRYSQHKHKDQKPVLSDEDLRTFRDVSADKSVVVLDEDRGLSETTIIFSTRFFAETLGRRVYGVTPVHSRHPLIFWPEIISTDAAGRVDTLLKT